MDGPRYFCGEMCTKAEDQGPGNGIWCHATGLGRRLEASGKGAAVQACTAQKNDSLQDGAKLESLVRQTKKGKRCFE